MPFMQLIGCLLSIYMLFFVFGRVWIDWWCVLGMFTCWKWQYGDKIFKKSCDWYYIQYLNILVVTIKKRANKILKVSPLSNVMRSCLSKNNINNKSNRNFLVKLPSGHPNENIGWLNTHTINTKWKIKAVAYLNTLVLVQLIAIRTMAGLNLIYVENMLINLCCVRKKEREKGSKCTSKSV